MRKLAFLLLGAGLLLVGVVALAQGGYELAWWRVAGGGTTGSTGGGYALSGTAGQSDAGVLAGGGHRWGGASAAAPGFLAGVVLSRFQQKYLETHQGRTVRFAECQELCKNASLMLDEIRLLTASCRSAPLKES